MVQQAKPVIGLNADYKSGQMPNPCVSFIFSGYYDAVQKAGGIPLILPPCGTESDMDQVLDMLDGLILVGGADLNPQNDGFMLHPSLRLMDSRREDFDRMLFAKAYDRRLPVFGIGAGMQLMNVSLGGTLFLHIPEDLGKALPHRDAMDPYHRHALLIEKESLFGRVYGDNEIRVNSMHHMAVDDVAPGFLTVARCPDSVIEGIESIRDDWFAFGTQFHPESTSATALDLRFFDEFVRGIIRRNKRFSEQCSSNESEESAEPKKSSRRPRRRTSNAMLFEEPEGPHITKSRKAAAVQI